MEQAENVAQKRVSATNRVTIRSSIVHHPDGGEMQHWGKPRSYQLQSMDEAHVAWVTVGEEWKQLDFGHVERPSTVIVENLLKSNEGIVEIAVETDVPAFCFLRQGRDVPLPEPRSLAVRCIGGKSKIRVIAIPS